MKYKRVVVTGSLAYDHIMSMPGSFGEHILPDKIHILNVSFIMETFRKEFGGTGGNIAYTLALLQTPAVLLGAAGRDFEAYRRHLSNQSHLVNMVKIFKDETTATGFVVTDRDDNQIWGFYQGAMKYSAKAGLIKVLKPGDLLVIAPNDPKAMLEYARSAGKLKIPYMFDPAFNIPHLAAAELRFAIGKCAILVGNDYEIELISQRLKIRKDKLVKNTQILITTLGAGGSEIKSGGKTYKIPAAKPKNISDPTGAGDVYRAGFLAGYVRGLPIPDCGRMGAVAAVYTVEKYGTQTHKFSPAGFEKRYRENFPG